MNTGLNTQNPGFAQPFRNPGGLGRRPITSTLSSSCTIGNSSISTTTPISSSTLIKSPSKLINKPATEIKPLGNQETHAEKENKSLSAPQIFKTPKLLQPQPFKPLTQYEPPGQVPQSQSQQSQSQQSQISCESEERKYENTNSQTEVIAEKDCDSLLDGLLPLGSPQTEPQLQNAEVKTGHSSEISAYD